MKNLSEQSHWDSVHQQTGQAGSSQAEAARVKDRDAASPGLKGRIK